jgi:RNA polymerase sigma factor (sigma-70 family)
VQGDAELVAAVRAGDPEAFAAVYDRYADRLHDFCHSVLRDRHEAADAMQDTFVLAAQRIGQLRDPEKLRPWLFAIARHEALRRAKARGRAVPTEDAGADVAAPGSSPEDVVSGRDAGAIVWEAAEGLSERDRVLLDLHLRQGLDGQELADAIGTSADHAYVLMSRLRDQVERALGALLVARLGREDCEVLQSVLAEWDGTFSTVWRKRVARHVERCEVCTEKRKTLVSPLSLLAAAPLVPAPLALRDQTLDRVRHVSTVRPIGAWRRPSARDGFPPPMSLDRRRRPLVAAVAVALFVLPAVIVAEPFGRGGGAPEVASAQRDLTTTTHDAPTTTSTVGAPTTTTTRQSSPVAPPPPPPDTTGPSLSASQQLSCANGPGSNVITAVTSDPSGIAGVTLSSSGPFQTSPATQAMSPSGGATFTATISWSSLTSLDTYTWTVTSSDTRGSSTSSGGSFVVQTSPCV